LLQTVELAAAEYLPASQLVQAVKDVDEEKVEKQMQPKPQTPQVEAAAAAYLPAPQSAQVEATVAPTAPENLPASQLVQTDEAADAAYLPAGQ
jgi:hypothetical protein